MPPPELAMVNPAKLEEALRCVEEGDLTRASELVGSLIRKKRLVRASTSSAASEEIDEVKIWLKRLIAEPDADDADMFLTRAYYKLRSQMPPDNSPR